MDQLLFGTFIEESASKLAYNVWKLHHATEPKFVQAGRDASAEGGLTGMESPLVGQPAPPSSWTCSMASSSVWPRTAGVSWSWSFGRPGAVPV